MASITLAQSALLSQDLLVRGVIESIVTVNPFYDLLPFMEIEGNALAYNRETVIGDSEFLAPGGVITAKAATTFTQATSNLTSLLGDAEVNGLIAATRSNLTSQKGVQVASKAKSIARTYQQSMITGVAAAGTNFDGIVQLMTTNVGQHIVANTLLNGGAGGVEPITGSTSNGGGITFELLDTLLDMVKDKDGEVDYIMMPARTRRSYFNLLRALGGADISETITLPGGRQVPAYRGVPIFVNDYIPINQVQGTSTTSTSVIAGTIDDGSGTMGISGLTASGNAGIRVEEVGTRETADETITRVKFYCGFANFSQLGIATCSGVTN